MRRQADETPAPTESRLSGLRPVAHDDDERPTREDRAADHSVFDLPAWVPRFLTRGKSRADE